MSPEPSGTSTRTGPGDPAAARDALWDAALTGDEYRAAGVVLPLLEAGTHPETVLLEVIAGVQAKVGTEWAANRLTVAQEHTVSAVNERVVAALAHHPAVRARQRTRLGGITVACVDGEWHALPARLLSEVLRLRGWRVDFLGAQVPTAHLIGHLHESGSHAVALSSSLPTRLPTAHAAISACQATGVPVLAGGAAFGPDGRYARLLGADAWAPGAREAADVLARGLPSTGIDRARQAIEDLPHLSDQEYTLVTRTAPDLVRQTFAGLEERFPAMRGYSEQQRRHTAEDVAHLVDFLAAALYTDDARLFTRFLTWTAGILTARGVPAASLEPALSVLRGLLHDFPRACAVLAEGVRAVGEDGAGPDPAPRTAPVTGKPA